MSNALVKIKNAQLSKKSVVDVPYSRFLYEFAGLLKVHGYILGAEDLVDGNRRKISINLGYDVTGVGLIKDLVRISKSGRRVYVNASKIPRYYSGYAAVFLSTSKGLLVDKEALKKNVGGELFCYVL